MTPGPNPVMAGVDLCTLRCLSHYEPQQVEWPSDMYQTSVPGSP